MLEAMLTLLNLYMLENKYCPFEFPWKLMLIYQAFLEGFKFKCLELNTNIIFRSMHLVMLKTPFEIFIVLLIFDKNYIYFLIKTRDRQKKLFLENKLPMFPVNLYTKQINGLQIAHMRSFKFVALDQIQAFIQSIYDKYLLQQPIQMRRNLKGTWNMHRGIFCKL